MRNKNISARKSNKRLLKIVLWTVFALVVLAGAAYASWYFLINPETRAGANKQLYSFTFKVTEWRYWARPEYQRSGSTSENEARTAWKDYESSRNGWEKVSLAKAKQDGHAPEVESFYNEKPSDFYFVRKEKHLPYTVKIPKSADWFPIGNFDGGWVENRRYFLEDYNNGKIPGFANGGKVISTGITFYELDKGSYQVNLKTSNGAKYPLDYRPEGSPYFWGAKEHQKGKIDQTFQSVGYAVHARYTGGGAYGSQSNPKGATAEIFKAYRTVKQVANQDNSYDSYYSYEADNSHYGLHAGVNTQRERAQRKSIKNEKIHFAFKAKDSSSDFANGRGLYILSEKTFTGNGCDEYAWTYANAEKAERHKDILHFSADILARQNKLNIYNRNGSPEWGNNPNYFESKLNAGENDKLKIHYGQGKFSGWKVYGDLSQGARAFNVGADLGKSISFAGKNYTVYPVLVAAPGLQPPKTRGEKFENIHIYWALGLEKGRTYECNYDYSLDQSYLRWLDRYLYNTEKGKQRVKEYQIKYQAETKKSITIKEAIEHLKNDSSLLINYRSLFYASTVREFSLKDTFFYDKEEGRKLEIASAEVYSDPVSNFHSFPYFKKKIARKGDDYPEKLYPNQWKIEDKYKGHKAELADGNIKISWLYKNTFQPNAYRIYRSNTQNFKPVGFGKSEANQIAKVESGSAAFKNREYVDVQAPMDGNDSYWYRIRAVYPGGQVTPWTKSFKAVSDIPRGKEAPPKEGEKPLKPSGVDAFGLPEIIELTWKPGATSESVPGGGGSSEGEGVGGTKKSEGVGGTKKTQRVEGEIVGREIGKLGSRTFDVYRTTVDPAPAGEQKVSSIFSNLINSAFAAATQSATGNWEKIKSDVRTLTSDGKKYIYNDKGLKNGKKYWYRVIETNQYGPSPASDYDMDIPHKHQDVNKDGFVNWIDVTRVLIYPASLGRKVVNRDVTEDVNDDWVVDWTDIYGSATKIGILKYPTFPEIISAAKTQPGGGGGSIQD